MATKEEILGTFKKAGWLEGRSGLTSDTTITLNKTDKDGNLYIVFLREDHFTCNYDNLWLKIIYHEIDYAWVDNDLGIYFKIRDNTIGL